MSINPFAPIGLAILVTIASSGLANAKEEASEQDGRDLAALSTMKVTLSQAIATAEQQAGGRAVSADVYRKEGSTSIVVEVAGPKGVQTVLVNAETGQITKITSPGQGDDTEEDED